MRFSRSKTKIKSKKKYSGSQLNLKYSKKKKKLLTNIALFFQIKPIRLNKFLLKSCVIF